MIVSAVKYNKHNWYVMKGLNWRNKASVELTFMDKDDEEKIIPAYGRVYTSEEIAKKLVKAFEDGHLRLEIIGDFKLKVKKQKPKTNIKNFKAFVEAASDFLKRDIS